MILHDFIEKSFTIVTPYIIPDNLPKKVNAGDGFIYDSAIRLIGYNPKNVFSSREELTEEKVEKINSTKLLIIAGANILKDNFEIIKNFNFSTLNKIKVPIALMGIGHYGITKPNINGFDEQSKKIFNDITERFPLVSVRCNGSYNYLKKSVPSKIELVLNTSCPVIFNVDNIFKNYKKKDQYNQLVVTITDRILINEQLSILPFAMKVFNSKKRILALHQDYKNTKLSNFAKKIGYEVFVSNNYLDYIELYKKTDIHFGNRVHAHLKCLSLGIPSFCTPFDLRQHYFAQSIGLPLVKDIKDESLKSFPFTNFLKHREKSEVSMNKFTNLILKNL